MSSGNHTFKHSETARLMRATIAAGLKVKAITIKDGKPYVEVVDSDAHDTSDADKPNPWNEDHAPDKKRSS